jgi:hypothetical protein
MPDYSEEFLNGLIHRHVPFEDLVECILGTDVRALDEQMADTWTDMVLCWRADGLSEEQCVDLFYHVVIEQLAESSSGRMINEIESFLGGCDGSS